MWTKNNFGCKRFGDQTIVHLYSLDLVTIIKALHETCNCNYHLQAGMILRLEKNGLPNFQGNENS